MKLFVVLLAGAVACAAQEAGSAVRVHEETRTFATWDVGEPDPVPEFEGFSLRPFPNYPYAQVKPVNKNQHDAAWRVVVIENEYLSCRVMPDLGGHIHGCTDKRTNREVFFANPVIRRMEDLRRGGFVSTGIETSFPIAHNRVSGWPVDYGWSLKDGVGRVVIEDTDRVSGMQWRVEFILRPGEAALEQRGTITNGGVARQGYQWWVNAAVEVDDPHLRAVYPTHWMLPHGEGNPTSWPISKTGVDLSDVANSVDQTGLFAHLSHEPWFAVYKPKFRSGVAHYADARQVRGKKVWFWGSKWDKFFRDNFTDGKHMTMEIQAGELETQPEFAYLEPGETKTFDHYWLPFNELDGVVRATRDVVLNVSRKGDNATVELTGTREVHGARVRLTNALKRVVWEGQTDLTPKEVFRHTAAASGKLTVDLRAADGAMLLHHVEGEFAAEPFNPAAKNPEPVEPKDDGHREEGPTLTREDFHEQREMWPAAWLGYKRALERAPDHLLLKVAEARVALALNRDEDAVELLKGTTLNAEGSYYYGVALARTRSTVEAKAALKSAMRDEHYRRAAQLEATLLDLRTGATTDLPKAEWTLHILASEAMADEGGPTVEIGALEVALLRRTGRAAEADQRLNVLLAIDPANEFLKVERMWLERNGDDAEVWQHLAADPERVVAQAEKYSRLGAYDDALKLLSHRYSAPPETEKNLGWVLPQDNPRVLYFRGYCQEVLKKDAVVSYATAAALSTRAVFPHERIEYEIFQAALRHDGKDNVAQELLGDLEFQSFRWQKALQDWRAAATADGHSAMVDRNLELALEQLRNNPETARELAKMETSRPHEAGAAKASGVAPAASTSKGADNPKLEAGPTTPESIAAHALRVAVSDLGGANGAFSGQNFPKEKQSPEVRQAYIEVRLRGLLAGVRDGHCNTFNDDKENLDSINPGLPFTNGRFGDFMKRAHFQYYLASAERLCQTEKNADRRWSRVSHLKEPIDSPDYVFPILAAVRAGEADAAGRVAAALSEVEQNTSLAADLRAFEKGALLLASGKDGEGRAALQKTAQAQDAMVAYLSAALLADGIR